MAKAEKFISTYEHSSYLSYVDVIREENILLTKNEFPRYFSDEKDFEDFHNDFLSFQDTDT